MVNTQELIDRIKRQVEEEVDLQIINSQENIAKIAMIAQGRALGFTVNNKWGKIEEISDEFTELLIEDSKKEIAYLKQAIRKSAKAKIKNIAKLEIPQLVSYTVRGQLNEIVEEEKAKIMPEIRQTIRDILHEEYVLPWKAVAKMQGINVSDLEE